MEDQTSQQFNKDEPYAETYQSPPTQPLPPGVIQSDDATSSSLDPGLPVPVGTDVSSSLHIPPRQPAQMRVRTLLLALLLASLALVGGNALLYVITVYAPTQRVLEAQAQARQATADAHASSTSFAQADAYAVATAAMEGTPETMATATAWHDFYVQATSGKPALADSLSGQSNARWDNGTSSDGKGYCTFTRGAYHASIRKTFYDAFCLAHAIQFRDFAFQVQMTILKGNGGSILFGADDQLQNFYQFYILKNSYSCGLDYSNNDGLVLSAFPLLISCPDTSHQPILLTIIVKYSYIYMFANKKYVASIKADKYSSGEIGVTGSPDSTAPIDKEEADVAFTNAQAWEL